MRHALAIALLLAMAAPLHAQDYRRNALGAYAAPTTHSVTSAGNFNAGPTNTSLDFALYYTRFITARFSMRLEARVANRNADVYSSNAVPGSGPSSQSFQRVEESFLEIPLILQSDKRVRFGDREVRISVGGGISYAILMGQTWYVHESSGYYWDEREGEFGDSQRLAFLLDGGVTMELRESEAVFLRFRWQVDGHILESDDVFAQEYLAYGFVAGFEWPF